MMLIYFKIIYNNGKCIYLLLFTVVSHMTAALSLCTQFMHLILGYLLSWPQFIRNYRPCFIHTMKDNKIITHCNILAVQNIV